MYIQHTPFTRKETIGQRICVKKKQHSSGAFYRYRGEKSVAFIKKLKEIKEFKLQSKIGF